MVKGTLSDYFKNMGLAKKADSKTPEIENQFKSLLDNAPALLKQVTADIEVQRADGVTEEQMKGLISKQGMLKLAVENKEIVEMIGRPLVGRLFKLIKGIGI